MHHSDHGRCCSEGVPVDHTLPMDALNPARNFTLEVTVWHTPNEIEHVMSAHQRDHMTGDDPQSSTRESSDRQYVVCMCVCVSRFERMMCLARLVVLGP